MKKLYMVALKQEFLDYLKSVDQLPVCFIRIRNVEANTKLQALEKFNICTNWKNLKITNVNITEIKK